VMNTTVDGEYQRYKAENGAYVREHFFGKDPRTKEMVAEMSDDEVWALRRGGLDYKKVYAAYKVATELDNGKPTVILAKTIKGWTLGPDVEGRNATHQIKELTNQQLMGLRERLSLQNEIPEEALAGENVPPYFRPEPGTPEHEYLHARRQELGGFLPSRVVPENTLELPSPETFSEVYAGSGKVEASTTTAFTRLLRGLARSEGFGKYVVPIVPDEARTFGMDSLFRELKIYASKGQLYEPVDASMILSYSESQSGQILEEGITEAGSMASWIAAGTSYATRGVPMVPFFIFYSMFGFQRVGDLIWSAADSRVRGFLLGATAGRTTLEGEGLQHQDGHSLVLATSVPVCEAYDPAFAYEVGTIVEHGLGRMYGAEPEDIFYYLTLYNENHPQPARPEGAEQGIVDGLYKWADGPSASGPKAAILFSGSANLAARKAAEDLSEHYDVSAELWSATSYKRLREEALAVTRWNLLHPTEERRIPMVTRLLSDVDGPVIAVTDYMRLVPDQVSRWVPKPFTTLGTDGFGRSDARKALRRHFEVDTGHIVAATLSTLAGEGAVPETVVRDAFDRYEIDPEAPDPAISR
jgi:pyruvate dehydrogenase E1 component